MATMIEREPQRAPIPTPAPARRRSREQLVFTGATAVALLHAVDDAFLSRQPGLDLSQHAFAALFSLVVGLGAIAVFGALRPGLRAATAWAFGVLAVVNGAMHVKHIGAESAAGSDITGVLALAAGVVLLGLAAAIPLLHRGTGTRTARWRWRNRAIAVAAVFVASLFVVGPICLAIVDTHKWREPIGAPPSAAYETVRFEASDGLALEGWYRPSRNGAAVLVVHGGNGSRMGTLRHAELLAKHGYGVLVYDSRGRGNSEGSPNGYGWDWEKDVAAALDVLAERPDVEPGRIGALGLSTGADALLHVAPDRTDVAAVVADGAAASGFVDWHRVRGIEIGTVPGWVMFKAMEVFTGDDPPPALEDQVARSDTPLMLISGEAIEHPFNEKYEAAAGGPVELWKTSAGHTATLRKQPAEYERRVLAFLDRELAR